MLHSFSQKFHPRSLCQLSDSSLLISVGLVDDVSSQDGGIEIFDCIRGQSVFDKVETCRLCAVTTLKKEADRLSGEDTEYVYVGTSKALAGDNDMQVTRRS